LIDPQSSESLALVNFQLFFIPPLQQTRSLDSSTHTTQLIPIL
jgi:hypothetical protein